MNNEKEYFAFISYKREDEKWAKWLQHKLEHYKLPSNLNGRTDLPKEIRPIFRDQSELAAGVLADEINKALINSKYLIVICSPRAAQSVWVGKEVQTFIDLGRTDKIIPFIIGGMAHAQNPEEECFPLALLNLPPNQELLGINIDEMGRDAAAVKVVAQMFGLKFDMLWQRYEREQKKKRNWMIMGSVFAFFVMAGIALWMYWQKRQVVKANWETMRNYAVVVSEQANRKCEEGDYYEARRLALSVLPKDLSNPDYPYTPEAEFALRKSFEYDSFIVKDTIVDEYNYSRIWNTYFYPQGNKIIGNGCDRIGIWDATTGAMEQLWIYSDGSDCNGDFIVFNNDSSLILYPNFYDLLLLNPDTGNVVDTLKLNEWIENVCVCPDKDIAIVSAGHTIYFWNVSKRVLMHTMDRDKSIKQVKILNGGKSIAIVDYHSTSVEIVDIETRSSLKYLAHPKHVSSIEVNPLFDQIATMCEDSVVRIWDVISGEIKMSLQGVFYESFLDQSLFFSSDGQMLYLTDSFRPTILWNLKTKKQDILTTIPDGMISFGKDSRVCIGHHIIDSTYNLLVKQMDKSKVKQMDKTNHKDVQFYMSENQNKVPICFIEGLTEFGKTFLVSSTSYTSDRRLCLVHGYYEDEEKVIDKMALFRNDKLVKIILRKENPYRDAFGCRISPKGKYYEYYYVIDERSISSTEEEGSFLCEMATGKVLWNPKEDIVFFHNDNYIVYPSNKRILSKDVYYVEIAEVRTGKVVQRIKTDKEIISITMSDDDRYVFAQEDDKSVKVWEFKPLQELIDQAKMQIEKKNSTKLEIKDFSHLDDYEFEENYYDD